MKRTQKKILGLAGLLIVLAMTVVAVFMPNNGARAATSTGFTDTLTVRVIGGTPDITITSPGNETTFVKPEQTITYDYEYMGPITATLEYTDEDGNTTTVDLGTFTPTEDYGSNGIPLNLEDYGYGDFVVRLSGPGQDNVPVEKFVEFGFFPVTGEATEDDNTGDVIIDLDYDEENPEIDHIQINVYDKDGNIIKELSPTNVPSPDKTVTLPFSDLGLPDGEYTFEIIAIGPDGSALARPYYTSLNYKAPESVPVPNTGGFLVGLNISQSDYLITGLIVFFIAGISGLAIVLKGRQGRKR